MLFVATFAALVALALPQAARAQESAAVGTVYDKGVYESLVSGGMSRDQARCASALPGAKVTLEHRVGAYFLPVDARRPGDHPEREPAEDWRGRRLRLDGGRR